MKSLLEQFLALDLVVLGEQDAPLLFCPERLVLMRLSPDGLRIAKAALSREAEAEMESEGVAGFLRATVDCVLRAPKLETFRSSLVGEPGRRRVLPKLVLMVNNYCNLQCRYCYEKETALKHPARCLGRRAIRTAIDRCYEFFETIETLMFIGGEPSLSEEAIEEGCEYCVSEAVRLGRRTPRFGMITNGVRISELLYAVIERFGIQLTFSVDGPKATHDLVRIRKDGTGSYDAVSLNIKRYAEAHAESVSIESTVTGAQADGGLSVSQRLNFIAEEFGVVAPHITVACLPEGHALRGADADSAALDEEFQDAVEMSATNILDELAEGDAAAGGPRLNCVEEMMRALAKRSATTAMCSAGTAQLVVDAHADVYPCWMFAGNTRFRMGNILTDDLGQILGSDVMAEVIANTRVTNINCSSCYARFVCHACIGNNYIRTGSIGEMDYAFCDRTRQSLGTVLRVMAGARM